MSHVDAPRRGQRAGGTPAKYAHVLAMYGPMEGLAFNVGDYVLATTCWLRMPARCGWGMNFATWC